MILDRSFQLLQLSNYVEWCMMILCAWQITCLYCLYTAGKLSFTQVAWGSPGYGYNWKAFRRVFTSSTWLAGYFVACFGDSKSITLSVSNGYSSELFDSREHSTLCSVTTCKIHPKIWLKLKYRIISFLHSFFLVDIPIWIVLRSLPYSMLRYGMHCRLRRMLFLLLLLVFRILCLTDATPSWYALYRNNSNALMLYSASKTCYRNHSITITCMLLVPHNKFNSDTSYVSTMIDCYVTSLPC